jgi:hypothetical protein
MPIKSNCCDSPIAAKCMKCEKMDRYVQEMNENVQKMHTLVIESTDLNKDIMRENRSLKTNCRQY